MKITIVYDNKIEKDIRGLKAGWGFYCFIQNKEKNIQLHYIPGRRQE